MDDGIFDRAWNPESGANDLVIVVPGGLIASRHVYAATDEDVAQLRLDLRNVGTTVRDPDSVWTTSESDENGGWIFVRRANTLNGMPGRFRRWRIAPVLSVHVRRTGVRVVRYRYEEADDDDPGIPLARGLDRVGRRVR